MLSFNQFLIESTYPYLFHGTTLAQLHKIKKQGLQPAVFDHLFDKDLEWSQKHWPDVYLTPNKSFAWMVANLRLERLPKKENDRAAVLVLDRNHPSIKSAEWKKDLDVSRTTDSGKKFMWWSIKTKDTIHPSAIKHVVTDPEELKKFPSKNEKTQEKENKNIEHTVKWFRQRAISKK